MRINIKDSYRFFYIFVFILIFLFLLSNLIFAENFDEEVRSLVLETETEFLDVTMAGISNLGNGAIDYLIASALPDEQANLAARRAVLVSAVSVLALKVIIGQKRPPGPIEYKHFTYDGNYHAMPSGHTATSFALAATISMYYPKYKYICYGLATLVGISRLYEDVHWASNVVAGAGVGYISAKFVDIHW